MNHIILALIACLIGISESGYAYKEQPANQSAGICKTNSGKIPASSVLPLNTKSVPFYQDLLDRCGSFISELTTAQDFANRISAKGDLMKAASVMKDAILAKARYLPPPFAGGANPHTLESIRVAASIVNSIYLSTEEALKRLGGFLVGQIRFITLQNAIELVRYSYDYLDSPYYLSNINTCYGGCQVRSLPSGYFKGVKNLALSYLQFQQGSGQATADDKVELYLAQAMVAAAKETLARSLSRRELSCAVSALHALEGQVKSALCTPNYGITLSESVNYVRSEIANVISSIEYLSDSGCQSHF